MRTLIMRSLLIVMSAFFITTSVNSQISVLQYRSVPSENIDEFIHRETTYWSEVAQQAVNEGKLGGWSLWQRVGGWGMDDESANFVFVNSLADAKSIDNMGDIWNAEKVFPNTRPSDMDTWSLGKVVHQVYLSDVGVVSDGTPFNYARVNYAKATDLDKYIELEQTVWMPFVKPLIEGGKTAQKYWSVARLVSPTGTIVPFNAITVDGFNALSDVLTPAALPQGVEFPDFAPFAEVHEKSYIQIYRLVKATQPKQ